MAAADHLIRSIQSDTALNDSDKTFTVPAGREWIVQLCRINLINTTGTTVSTATKEPRQVEVQLRGTTDAVLFSVVAGASQALGLTRDYDFAIGGVDQSSFVDTDLITNSLPNVTLASGYDVRVFDNKVRHSTADDMTVRLTVLERDTPV